MLEHLNNYTAAHHHYAESHSTPVSPILLELAEYTKQNVAEAQMLIGQIEGQLLKMLTQLSGARNILEIGTFTGYSALAMAEGLPEDGKLITCDIDEELTKIARQFWAQSPHGKKIELKLGPALDTIESLSGPFDLVFIDADKSNYENYYEAVLPKTKSGGVIVLDNTLWRGEVIDPQSKHSKLMDAINKKIADDTRVEAVVLTVRDGVTIVIKK